MAERNNSVEIEIITIEGQRDSVLAIVQTADYGMTDFIDNGDNQFTITGKIPIANLTKLNLLANPNRFNLTGKSRTLMPC